jgi:hypothetical protein
MARTSHPRPLLYLVLILGTLAVACGLLLLDPALQPPPPPPTVAGYPNESGTFLAQIQPIDLTTRDAAFRVCVAPGAPESGAVRYGMTLSDQVSIEDRRQQPALIGGPASLQAGQIVRLSLRSKNELRTGIVIAQRIIILADGRLPTAPFCVDPSFG